MNLLKACLSVSVLFYYISGVLANRLNYLSRFQNFAVMSPIREAKIPTHLTNWRILNFFRPDTTFDLPVHPHFVEIYQYGSRAKTFGYHCLRVTVAMFCQDWRKIIC